MNNKTKHCYKCKETLDISFFSKNKSNKDKLAAGCKKCAKICKIKYQRTKHGLSKRIYSNQVSRSIKRNYDYPTYSSIELKEWLYGQPLFHTLYDNWKRLDFQKSYIPSVDRKNDYIGYTMDNIQLMTWGENSSKYCSDKKCGRNIKTLKSVYQKYKNGDMVNKFYSIAEAERQTSISSSDISRCCKKKNKFAGGFVWEYAEQNKVLKGHTQMLHPLLNESSTHYSHNGQSAIQELEKVQSVASLMGWVEGSIFKYEFRKDLKGQKDSDLKKIATYKAYREVLKDLLHKGYRRHTVSHAMELEGINFDY